MNKYIYDENNGLWYERKGDYYLQEHKSLKELALLNNEKLKINLNGCKE